MKTFFFSLVLSLLVGCASAIPREYLATVNRSLTYPVVKADVPKYVGAVVIWGGIIHETRNTSEGTYVEIIESPLDSRDRPLGLDRTRGRFLALFPGYAEAVQYASGKAVTVVGEVRGIQELPLGEIRYPYPVILHRYDRFWKPKTNPEIRLGIGVGGVFTH